MKRKIKIDEENYQRIIIVSDIHAHLEQLDKFLNEIDLQENELLVINGDFINRGADNLAVLHKVMQLDKKDNVIVLAGNHEAFILEFLTNKSFIKKIFKLFKKQKYPTVLGDMYQELKDLYTDLPQKAKPLVKLIKKHYKKEYNFLKKLPILVEGKEHIIVHAGYEKEYDLKNDKYAFLKNDDFAYLDKEHDKMIIVGHAPVCNIRKSANNYPLYQAKNNVYAIDGALGVLETGELNVLIISPRNNNFAYDIMQINNFKKAILNKNVNVACDLDNQYLHLALAEGEEVLVVKTEDGQALIKYKHQFYWVTSDALLIEKG